MPEQQNALGGLQHHQNDTQVLDKWLCIQKQTRCVWPWALWPQCVWNLCMAENVPVCWKLLKISFCCPIKIYFTILSHWKVVYFFFLYFNVKGHHQEEGSKATTTRKGTYSHISSARWRLNPGSRPVHLISRVRRKSFSCFRSTDVITSLFMPRTILFSVVMRQFVENRASVMNRYENWLILSHFFIVHISASRRRFESVFRYVYLSIYDSALSFVGCFYISVTCSGCDYHHQTGDAVSSVSLCLNFVFCCFRMFYADFVSFVGN